MLAVETKDLSFKYTTSPDWILKNVNLQVQEGEFVAITGPSGAGKTTLCLTLNGIIPNSISGPYQGTVRVFGKNPLENQVSDMAKIIGITFQEPEAQLFGLTVEEEVAFGPENYALPREEISKRVDDTLDLLRLVEMRSKSPFNLSGGQKQRVALASVLALRPRLLVLDEPFTELDPIGKVEVSDAIEVLKREYGITIILVEHESEEIVRHADRVILLDKGNIEADLSTSEFFDQVQMLHEHGVRPPQITELFWRLKRSGLWQRPLPISYEDGLSQLRRILKHGKRARLKENGELNSREKPIVAEFKGVSYIYPDGTRALENATLSIAKGEYVGLVGQNGSGKTTLAKIMLGLIRPTTGAFLLDGIDSKDMTVAQMARKVGYLFQNPDHQIFSPTVLDEVSFGPRNLDLSPEIAKDLALSALSKVGLLEIKDSHPLFTSRGERQRIALASILSMQPEVVILDEPTTGQDWVNNLRILDMADELNRSGKTIIMISHNMRIMAERTRRIVAMSHGSIILDAATREAFSEFEKLERAFIRPPQAVRLSKDLRDDGVSGIALSVEELSEALSPCLA